MAMNNLNDVSRILALVSLTGSAEVGSELHSAASKYLQRVPLELGGNDPFIVFADCDFDKAVDEVVNGRIHKSYKRYFWVASECY